VRFSRLLFQVEPFHTITLFGSKGIMGDVDART